MDLITNGKLNLAHPVIVVPMTFFCASLAIAPLVVWTGEIAATFYGAIVSASAAVIAVILTSSLDSKKQRDRDDRLRNQNVVAAARVGAYELRQCTEELAFMHSMLDLQSLTVDQPVEMLRINITALFNTPILDGNLLPLCSLPEPVPIALLNFLQARNIHRRIIEMFLDANLKSPQARLVSVNPSAAGTMARLYSRTIDCAVAATAALDDFSKGHK
jgi:hypothetical protein